MMFNYIKTERGFSLVEMLVSVSILLLVIIGPMTMIARTSKSSTFASEQVQAFFLAQEGLELAQKSRDDLVLDWFVNSGSKWTAFTNEASGAVYSNCYKSTGCGLEWNSGSTVTALDCAAAVDSCLIRLSSGNTRFKFTYTATGNTPTDYTRVIKFKNYPNSVLVTSTVTWRTGTLVASQKVETTTFLYNVYETP